MREGERNTQNKLRDMRITKLLSADVRCTYKLCHAKVPQ